MTAPAYPTTGNGGEIDAPWMGVVTDASRAGGTASPPCKYCGEIDGHTAQCVVVSHHARLGFYARWTCAYCTSVQYPGRYPCKECTGYTTSTEKTVRGITTVYGKPMAGCLQ